MQVKNWVRIAICSMFLAAGCASVLISPASADFRHWERQDFTNTTLTTQDGVKVHFYDDLLKEKSSPSISSTRTVSIPVPWRRRDWRKRKLLGDRVGKDIFFYSISIDPVRDTPAALKAYAEKFHAGPGWIFLTGKKEDIDLLSKKLGLYSDPKLKKTDILLTY